MSQRTRSAILLALAMVPGIAANLAGWPAERILSLALVPLLLWYVHFLFFTDLKPPF